jgi:type I restriction enzyme M protein
VTETQRLARMNLAVHGLGGTIREANSYYEEPFPIVGHFDFVMVNPPFNVDGVDKEKDAIRKRADRSRSACRSPTTRTTSGSRCSGRR